MDDVAMARIQLFRDKAAEESRLKIMTKSERAKALHESAARQWLQLAEIAEGLERTFPLRPLNRAAERVGAPGPHASS